MEALLAEIETPSLVCGEFNAEEREMLARDDVNIKLVSAALSVRRPSLLAELAWARWQRGEVDEEASLAPIYLHTTESNAP
jgi:tRNA threonylcarbamoyladenosine biosynthesis protein TsaB